MRTKTAFAHRRPAVSPPPPSFFTIPLLSATQDEYNGTTFETSSESESDDKQQQFHVADCIHQDESINFSDKNICICCNQGGGVLVCSQTTCHVTLHVKCIDSVPKFDDFGNFYCPYCWYKRAVDKCQELREKAMTAKKVLSSFLDKNGGSMMKEVVVGDGDNRHDATNGVQSQNLQERKKYVADQDSMNLEKFNKPDTFETRDARNKDRKEIKDLGHNMEDGCERIVEVGEEVLVEPLSGSGLGMCAGVQSQNVACDKGAEETVANLAEDKGKIKDQGKLPHVEQKVSSTSSSMSEANDSDFEVVSLKKGLVKRKFPETSDKLHDFKTTTYIT